MSCSGQLKKVKIRSCIVRGNIEKETYTSCPTNVMSAPLTVGIRFAMTLTVSTRVVRGAPDQNVQITLFYTMFTRIYLCVMTCVRNSHHQDPTSLRANATSCSCKETLNQVPLGPILIYLFGTQVRPSMHWSFWSQSPWPWLKSRHDW